MQPISESERLEIAKKLQEAGALFRTGQEAYGAQTLRSAINMMLKAGQQPSFNELMRVLPEALAAQARQDWVGLADYLEFDIPETLLGTTDTTE